MDRNAKLIEVLSKRTVANGCTIEEEKEAKRKIAELRAKQPKGEDKYDQMKKKEYKTYGDVIREAESFVDWHKEMIRRTEEKIREYEQRNRPNDPKNPLRCPRCGGYDWYKGSYGGISQNILCASCLREYNHVSGFGILHGYRFKRPIDLERAEWYGVDLEPIRKNKSFLFTEIWDNSTLYYKAKYILKQFTKKCCKWLGFNI